MKFLFLYAIVWGVISSSFGVSPVLAAGLQKESGSEKEVEKCPAAREFVTSLEFLRSQKEWGIPEAEARKISEKVAQGCQGAAKRMITTSLVLSKAGMGSKDALANGLLFAERSEDLSQNFSSFFKSLFLEDHLDLSLNQAVQLSKKMTLEYEGDSDALRKDFDRFVKFCVSESSLDLPKNRCARLSSEFALLGKVYGKKGVFSSFEKLYGFLRSNVGPGLSIAQSFVEIEAVLGKNEMAAENFIIAYRYASSESGLGLGAKDAMEFAKKMASHQVKTASKE